MGGFGFQQTELRAVGHGGRPHHGNYRIVPDDDGANERRLHRTIRWRRSNRPASDAAPAGQSVPQSRERHDAFRTGSADRARPGKRWRAAGATDGPDAGWCAAGAEAGKRNDATRASARVDRSTVGARLRDKRPARPTRCPDTTRCAAEARKRHDSGRTFRTTTCAGTQKRTGAARASAGSGTRRPRSARPGGWRAGAG